MSYRDIRNFTESLRALGYPNAISIESFRKPNFPLVANLLVWLVKRFDQDVSLNGDVNTSDERVALLKSVAEFMVTKASIKLNTKRLYQADGYAVKELLKVTSVLYQALKTDPENDEGIEDSENVVNLRDFDISDKVAELKQCRTLASEITKSGANLFDLLGKEIEIRPLRQKCLNRQFELQEVENGLRKAIDSIKQEIAETNQLIDNVSVTEANLDAKIERRKVEIDRYEKRLQSLKKVRPAFLDEFSALEKELEALFEQYSVRLRCLGYLENMASEAERNHLQRQQILTAQRVANVVPLENRGDATEMLSLEDSPPDQKQVSFGRPERPRASTGGRSKLDKGMKPHPEGDGSPNNSSLDLSTDSDDSDDLFLDRDEPELAHSEDESLELELSGLDRRAPSGRKTMMNRVQSNSDDDF